MSEVKREILEEIGLELQEKDLIKIGTRIHQVSHENGIQDNEHHHIFIAELKTSVEKLTPQEEEVTGLKLWNLKILKDTKNLDNVLLPRFHDYYCFVYDQIDLYLKSN